MTSFGGPRWAVDHLALHADGDRLGAEPGCADCFRAWMAVSPTDTGPVVTDEPAPEWREHRAFLARYPYLDRRSPAPRCWPLPWRPFGLGHPWESVVWMPDRNEEAHQCTCGRWLKVGPSGGAWRVWRWR